MKTHSLLQGSPEWLAYRMTKRNASDAPAMFGCSPYETRNQLIARLATGIAPEVDAGLQRRFDDGHRFEALARPLASEIVGQALYPVTGSKGNLSASFDGLTMDEIINWEHKGLNDTLRTCLPKGVICNIGKDEFPLMYRVQMEQQMDVCDTVEKTLFSATNWDADGNLLDERHGWYYPDLELRAQIIAGWAQFEIDLAAYVPTEAMPVAVAKSADNLPVVFDMRVEGRLVSCNIEAYKPAALAYIEKINTKLLTDQDFADADIDAKYCRSSAKKLDLAIEQALGQMGDINTALNTVREIAESFNRKGLALEKLVKSEKDGRKLAIVTEARIALTAHIAALNTRLGKPYMPTIQADFAGAIKGLQKIESTQNAVDTELARAKIAANQVADQLQSNMKEIDGLIVGLETLFPDYLPLVLKDSADMVAVVKNRISEHKASEAKRIEAEREKIRIEERAALEKEAADAAALAAVPAIAEPVVEKTDTTAPAITVVTQTASAASCFKASVKQLSTRFQIDNMLDSLDEKDLKLVLHFVVSLDRIAA